MTGARVTEGSSCGHLERGEVNLSFVNLLKVAAALGVDARELVKGLAQELGAPRDV